MSFRKKNDNGNEYFYEVTLPTLAYYMHFMHAVLQDANACNAQFFFWGLSKKYTISFIFNRAIWHYNIIWQNYKDWIIAYVLDTCLADKCANFYLFFTLVFTLCVLSLMFFLCKCYNLPALLLIPVSSYSYFIFKAIL